MKVASGGGDVPRLPSQGTDDGSRMHAGKTVHGPLALAGSAGPAGLLAVTACLISVRGGIHSRPQALPALVRDDFQIFGAGYLEQVTQGFKPRSDVPAVRLHPPLDWDMDPFNDRNWRFQLSAWRMLDPIWSQWYEHDWSRLSRETMPWVEDWYRYHVAQRRSSKFEWYDMATGLRAQHIALLLYLQQRHLIALDTGQLRQLHWLARMHVRKLRERAFINSNNHGIFQIQGLRLLCLVWKGEECRGRRRIRRG